MQTFFNILKKLVLKIVYNFGFDDFCCLAVKIII